MQNRRVGYGLRDRASAYHAQNPEFKPIATKKENNNM
jgi:hypothetical protein